MRKQREQENTFYKKNFIEIAQIQQLEQLQYLFQLAAKLTELHHAYDPVLKNMLEMFTVAVVFYQQSSRTYGSFVSASQLLGANVIAVHDMAHFSSVAKGENKKDSAITTNMSWGADILVQRHPDNDSSREVAAKFEQMGVHTLTINAGAGTEEHPTQALADAYTIFKEFGSLDDLHIAMVGDMKFGRTVKSLAKLLATVGKNIKITFVAPQGLEMPAETLAELDGKVQIVQTNSLDLAYGADVVYWTRVQREWFEKEGTLDFYEQIKDEFILTPEVAARFSPDAIFMHPLPRVNEISEAVDSDHRAKYFEQMANAHSVRMALLSAMLIKDPYSKIDKD